MWKLLSKGSAPDRQGPGTARAGGEGAARASGYDRVAVITDAGGTEWMTKGQFQALALTERVRLLAGGDLRFYRGNLEIAPSEAMRGLP
jgi:hypothetical protein